MWSRRVAGPLTTTSEAFLRDKFIALPPLCDYEQVEVGEEAHTESVEAEEDALGDEKAFHDGANIFEGHVLFHSFALSCAEPAFFAVAEDASDNQGSEVSHLGEIEAAHGAENERPKAAVSQA